MREARENRRQNGLSPDSQRFLGVQWRLLLSHIEVAVGAAMATALLMMTAVANRSGLATAILIGLGAVFLATIGGAWVGFSSSRRLKLRLREASRFASALARGDYRQRIGTGTAGSAERFDEIDQLAGELNAMADSLEAAIGDLRTLAERNRALAEEAGRFAALEERTRLARDLHDTVNQQVFSLSMQAAAARRRLEAAEVGDGRLSEVVSLLGAVEALARSAHSQMRDLILQLRPTTLEQQGLGAALEEYAKTFAEAAGLECACNVAFPGRLAPPIEEALFRIAQEALNNVAKHSGATGFEITLDMDAGGWVSLRVRDGGRGFDLSRPVRATALGLRGLRERVAALGGRLKIDSHPGRGTTLGISFQVTEVPVAVPGGAVQEGPVAAGGVDRLKPVTGPAAGKPAAQEEDASSDPDLNL
jgi:NarL family two-component system sensor histidine kinase LiaS